MIFLEALRPHRTYWCCQTQTAVGERGGWGGTRLQSPFPESPALLAPPQALAHDSTSPTPSLQFLPPNWNEPSPLHSSPLDPPPTSSPW